MWRKYFMLRNEKGKMRPTETIPGMGRGGMKDGG
jgi:hypothetical protein